MNTNTPSRDRGFLIIHLLTAALLLALGTGPAQAASAGDLNLSGVVATACDVSVTPVSGVADNLPLSAAASDLTVASINERCNDPDGYTLTAQSSSSSVLTPVGPSPDSVPYTFKYNLISANLSGGAVNLTNVTNPTGPSGVTKSVAISWTDPGFIAADTYTDTITFTIAAK